LTTYGAGKTAKDVGIVGIGGLGHFGLLFAKALGANVTAISHSESKKADAEKMGATRFIATHGGDKDNFEPYARSLDLIICTSSKFSKYLTVTQEADTRRRSQYALERLPVASSTGRTLYPRRRTGKALASDLSLRVDP
jgi:D-arabinose 1-dehydrogenase-like Zn-dependent alcohol dehydrogenase